MPTWPLWLWAVLQCLNVLVTIAHNGKPRIGNYDATAAIIGAGLWFFILKAGGFFIAWGVQP